MPSPPCSGSGDVFNGARGLAIVPRTRTQEIAMNVGDRVKTHGGYTAIVRQLGTVPADHPHEASRGLPGALVEWDWLNTETHQVNPPDVSTPGGDTGWVESTRLFPI